MQSTLAVISAGKILKNLRAIRAKTKVPLMAVVKDDAYGHGAECISLLLEPHVDSFAVATVSEGISLRTAGVRKEILVLTPPLSEEDALFLSAHELTATVSSRESFEIMRKASKEYKQPLRFSLKVNTGMNRYGLPPQEVKGFCRRAKGSGAEIVGVFSHLYAPEDIAARETQYGKFCFASEIVREFYPNAVRHLAATGGILAGEKFHFDLVRCGIALYGYLPSGFSGALKLSPAMKVYAPVAQSFSFTGGGVCYRPAEREYDKLKTLRLGYGDGFFRDGEIGNVNPLCMDAFVREGKKKSGMELVLSNAEEYAKIHGTIVYDVLVRIGKKAEKRYV